MTPRRRWRDIVAKPGLALVPGAYDALSARVIEAQGFEAAFAGGYAAVGTLLAEADGGQSTMRDYADHYGRICDAVNVPVFVDADTGFGGVHNVRRTVRAFERAGVAGLFISDQVFPNRCGYMPGKAVIPVEEMLAKLKSALDARTDPDFFIAGRTDVLAIDGFDAAVERCGMFMELGADMAMPHGADTPALIRAAMKSIPGPHMAIQSHAAGRPRATLQELEDCGVNTVIFPSAALFAAVGGVTRAMRALKKDGSFDAVENELVPLDAYYDLVGLDFYNDYERACVEEGERVAGRKTGAE